uniref:GNAT family N-acetyltransferase n=1 Tax=Alistipes sp. TaxID=1872444 RepID=UPI0040578E1E
MEQQPIISALDREVLKSELTQDRCLRTTQKASNEIYVFKAKECPSLMREVGRLREEAFRLAGGGTGEEIDVDAEDLAEDGYSQLIVWDPVAEQIVGGYRFIVCHDEHPAHLSTEHYFRFSERFRQRFLPYTIELGRSFVQPDYQARRNPKSLYALDNLWDGLGALVVLNPKAKYLFGKVTMYASFNVEARNTLFYFLKRYFADRDALVEGIHRVPMSIDEEAMVQLFVGESYEENRRILVQRLRELGEGIPPLINAYMGLSPTMRLFDTVVNPDFGDVEETGILVTIKDVYPEKKLRHIRWEGWRRGLKLRREEFLRRWSNLFTLRKEKE